MGGLRLLADYPFGAGAKGFKELGHIYNREVVEPHDGEQRAPHNTVTLVGTEWGLPGLPLYFSFYATLFMLLRRIRKRDPAGGLYYYRSVALQVAMAGCSSPAVHGSFVCRGAVLDGRIGSCPPPDPGSSPQCGRYSD